MIRIKLETFSNFPEKFKIKKNKSPITPQGSCLKVIVIKNKIIVGHYCMVLYLKKSITGNSTEIQDFWISLLQSIEDRLRAINSASSETQRCVIQMYWGSLFLTLKERFC